MDSIQSLMQRSFRVFECKGCKSVYINAEALDKHTAVCVKHNSEQVMKSSVSAASFPPHVVYLKEEPVAPAESVKSKSGKYKFKPVAKIGRPKGGRKKRTADASVLDEVTSSKKPRRPSSSIDPVPTSNEDDTQPSAREPPPLTAVNTSKGSEQKGPRRRGRPRKHKNSTAASDDASADPDFVVGGKSGASKPISTASDKLDRRSYDAKGREYVNTSRRFVTVKQEKAPVTSNHATSTRLTRELKRLGHADVADIIVPETPEAPAVTRRTGKRSVTSEDSTSVSSSAGMKLPITEPTGQLPITEPTGQLPKKPEVEESLMSKDKIMAVMRTDDYMCRYLTSREFSDAVIKTDMGDIPIHRVVLASRYPQLSQALLTDAVIDMSDLTYGDVSSWLKYIYTNDESGLAKISAEVLNRLARFILQSATGYLSAISSTTISASLLSQTIAKPVNPVSVVQSVARSQQSFNSAAQRAVMVTSTPLYQGKRKIPKRNKRGNRRWSPRIKKSKTLVTTTLPLRQTRSLVQESAAAIVSKLSRSGGHPGHGQSRDSKTTGLKDMKCEPRAVDARVKRASGLRKSTDEQSSKITPPLPNPPKPTKTNLTKSGVTELPKHSKIDPLTHSKSDPPTHSKANPPKHNKTDPPKQSKTDPPKQSKTDPRKPGKASLPRLENTDPIKPGKTDQSKPGVRTTLPKEKSSTAKSVSIGDPSLIKISPMMSSDAALSPSVTIARLPDCSLLSIKLKAEADPKNMVETDPKIIAETGQNSTAVEEPVIDNSMETVADISGSINNTNTWTRRGRGRGRGNLPPISYNIHKFTDNSLTKRNYGISIRGKGRKGVRGGRGSKQLAEGSYDPDDMESDDKSVEVEAGISVDTPRNTPGVTINSADVSADFDVSSTAESNPLSPDSPANHTPGGDDPSVPASASKINMSDVSTLDGGSEVSAAELSVVQVFNLITDHAETKCVEQESLDLTAYDINSQPSKSTTCPPPNETALKNEMQNNSVTDSICCEPIEEVHHELTENSGAITEVNVSDVTIQENDRAMGDKSEQYEATKLHRHPSNEDDVCPSDSQSNVCGESLVQDASPEEQGSTTLTDPLDSRTDVTDTRAAPELRKQSPSHVNDMEFSESGDHGKTVLAAGEGVQNGQGLDCASDVRTVVKEGSAPGTHVNNPDEESDTRVKDHDSDVDSVSIVSVYSDVQLLDDSMEDETLAKVPLNDSGKRVPLNDNGKQVPLNDSCKQLPLNDSSKQVPLNDSGKQVPLSDSCKQVPLNVSSKQVPLNDCCEQVPPIDGGKQVLNDRGKQVLDSHHDEHSLSSDSDVQVLGEGRGTPTLVIDEDKQGEQTCKSSELKEMTDGLKTQSDPMWNEFDGSWGDVSSRPNQKVEAGTKATSNFRNMEHPATPTRGTHKAFVPSPMTPMENFNNMSDRCLQERLRRYGLRDKMSRKRMLAALTQIYTETHQYETDTSAEWTVHPTPRKQPRVSGGDTGAGDNAQRNVRNLGQAMSLSEEAIDLTASDVEEVLSNSALMPELKSVRVPTEPKPTAAQPGVGGVKSDLDKLLDEVDVLIDSSDEEKLPNQTLNLNSTDTEDEDTHGADNVIGVNSYVADDVIGAYGHGVELTTPADMDTALKKLIAGNDAVYKRILSYEMVPRDELVNLVKSAGIKCSVKRLEAYCYKQCIQVQNKQDQDRRKKRKVGTNSATEHSKNKGVGSTSDSTVV